MGAVDVWGIQPERVYVEVDSADWAQLGLTAAELRRLFEARNIVEPGGELDTEHARYAVFPTGEFTTVTQMNDLVVARAHGGLPVRLGDLPVTVDRRYEEPPRTLCRLTRPGMSGQPCLVLGVSMKAGHNVVEMGASVETALDRLREGAIPPDVALTRVNDLPRQVDSRISGR